MGFPATKEKEKDAATNDQKSYNNLIRKLQPAAYKVSTGHRTLKSYIHSYESFNHSLKKFQLAKYSSFIRPLQNKKRLKPLFWEISSIELKSFNPLFQVKMEKQKKMRQPTTRTLLEVAEFLAATVAIFLQQPVADLLHRSWQSYDLLQRWLFLLQPSLDRATTGEGFCYMYHGGVATRDGGDTELLQRSYFFATTGFFFCYIHEHHIFCYDP